MTQTNIAKNSPLQNAVKAVCEVAEIYNIAFKKALILSNQSNILRAWALLTETEAASAALASYGIAIDEMLLNLLVELRCFQTILWNYLIGQHDPRFLERLEVRLRWFRKREN